MYSILWFRKYKENEIKYLSKIFIIKDIVVCFKCLNERDNIIIFKV